MPVPSPQAEIELNTTLPTGSPRRSGASLWKWTASRAEWAMLEDQSAPGYEPGQGPGQPGRFDGQIVRWSSVPSAVKAD